MFRSYVGTTLSDRYLYILLEFVPGGSVASMLVQFGAFSEPLIRYCFAVSYRNILQAISVSDSLRS